MKNQIRTRRGFSLVELLVALSILAVVAAIIVPRFLNVREQAADTSAKAQIAAINNVYQQWRSLGGDATYTNANAAQIIETIRFLQTTGNNTVNRGIVGSPCTDTMGDFGSRTVAMQPVTVGGAAAAAITASTPDGFYNATAANGIAPASAVYKVGNVAYRIALNVDSGFSIVPNPAANTGDGYDITAN